MNRYFAPVVASLALLAVCQPGARLFAAAESAQMRVEGVQPPRKTRHVAPVYPPVALAARVQGLVIIEATIDPMGRVAHPRVIRSVPLLDDAALEAVRQWEFAPTYLNGVAVPVIMTLTVNFTLVPGGTAGAVPSMSELERSVRSPRLDSDHDLRLRKALADLRAWVTERNDPSRASATASAPAGMNVCAAEPSYSVTPLRWERFPLRVYIEEVELDRRNISATRKARIVALIMKGLDSWSVATGGRLGSVIQVRDFRNAHLNVVFRNGTGNTIHDSVQGPFIRHATIMFDIQRWESFPDKDHRIVNGIAHEMGHVLGIGRETSMPGTLMTEGPEQLTFEAPQQADVNSILAKYGICG